MDLDALLKRYFPGVLCALIAPAAYFQASGISSLVSSTWLSEDPPHARAIERGTVAFNVPDDHARSAGPILSRNPFDSITGPLDGTVLDLGAVPEPKLNEDPYADPDCTDAQVLLILESEDPAWSFAAIATSGAKPKLRRENDKVGDRTVGAISWDRAWLVGKGGRCQARLGSKVAVKRPAKKRATPPSSRKRRSRRGALPPAIASKIQKISETEVVVDRSALDAIIEKQAELLRSTRVRPVKQGGKVVGVRLARVPSNSLLGTLGLKSGDQVRSINGFDLTDPQKALEAYARLRSATDLAVAVKRRGKDMTLDVHIR